MITKCGSWLKICHFEHPPVLDAFRKCEKINENDAVHGIGLQYETDGMLIENFE